MPNVRHSDLAGADLHPPGPHTHPDSDLSSFSVLDARYLKSAFVTVGTSEATYVTDGDHDEVQINEAIDTMAAAGGGTVFLKAGIYILEDSIILKSNVALRGSGNGTILRYANGSTFGQAMIGNLEFVNDIEDFVVDTSGIVLENFAVDGNSANVPINASPDVDQQNMIGLRNVTDCTLRNLYLYNCPDSAIAIDRGSSNNVITNCVVDTTVDIGLYISDTIRTRITNNTVRNTASYGIRVIKYNTGYAKTVLVAHNTVLNCGSGLTVDGIILQEGAEQCVVQGNVVVQAARTGIRVYNSAYNSVTGNCVLLSGQHGISVELLGRGQVTGNLVHQAGQTTTNTYAGIYLNNASEESVTGNRSGDAGSGTRQRHGIQEAGTSNNNIIVANMVQRNQTSGVVTVGAQTVSANNL